MIRSACVAMIITAAVAGRRRVGDRDGRGGVHEGVRRTGGGRAPQVLVPMAVGAGEHAGTHARGCGARTVSATVRRRDETAGEPRGRNGRIEGARDGPERGQEPENHAREGSTRATLLRTRGNSINGERGLGTTRRPQSVAEKRFPN